MKIEDLFGGNVEIGQKDAGRLMAAAYAQFLAGASPEVPVAAAVAIPPVQAPADAGGSCGSTSTPADVAAPAQPVVAAAATGNVDGGAEP